MACDRCRETLSAALDDEVDSDAAPLMSGHLSDCAACRDYERSIEQMHRMVRVRAADPVPDLRPQIMAAVRLPTRRPVSDWTEVGLLAVGMAQLVLALPPLLLGQGSDASSHMARELGSLNVAFAAGLLLAAWQPRRISGLLPVAAALAVITIIAAVADVAAGHTTPALEAYHLLEVLGLVFLWLAGRRADLPDRKLSARSPVSRPHPA